MKIPSSVLRFGVVGVFVTAVGVLAVPASAHTELLRSSPAANARVTGVYDVSLTFSDPLRARFVKVQVRGDDGERYEDRAAVVEGRTVRQPVNSLGPGSYTIVYRVVSADGHPVSGRVPFDVAPTAVELVQTIRSQTVDGVANTAKSNDGTRNWLMVGAGLVLVAAVGFVVYRRRAR